jgi:biopolymer transport protein ExbB
MGPTNVVPGWTGRALEFDGVDEEVVVGPLDTDEWTELTMSAWLYHATDGDERALSKADGSAGMDHVFFVGGIDGDVKVRVQTDGDGGQTVELKPDATLPVETWTHVAVTWTADTGDIVLFVDGQEVARDMLSGTTLLDQASDVMLANAFPAGDRSWHGRLDEVRLERIARTPAWILTQYASMTDTLAQYGAEQAMP